MTDVAKLLEQWHSLHREVISLIAQNQTLIQMNLERQQENAKLQAEIAKLRRETKP